MKNTLIYFTAICVFIFSSCKNKQSEKIELPELPTFDLQQEYPLKRVFIQDVADVEYIPLETKKGALLTGVPKLCMNNEIIVIANMQAGEIVFFDRKGNHLNTFSRKGRSGEEYSSISSMSADFNKKEVYIFNYRPLANSFIKVYSFQGEFLRSFETPVDMRFDLFDYNDDYLFAEEYLYVDLKDDKDVNHTPYYLISKQTGELKELPIKQEGRLRNSIVSSKDIGNTVIYTSLYFSIYPISKLAGKIVIADFAADTIFTYHDNQLFPVAIKTNKITKHQSTIIAGMDLMTEKFIVLCTQDKRVDSPESVSTDPQAYTSPDSQQLLYNRQSGEFNRVQFDDANGILADESHMLFGVSDHELPSDYAIRYYRPGFLLEKYEKGELKGNLEIIASKLKEDDNPVLVIAKFKK